MAELTHLHCHNMYSLLDGLGSPDQFAKKANKLGQKYLAVTNHGSTDGLISFQKSCLDNDILPISGVEFYIVPEGMVKEKGEKRGHLTAWIKNEKGYHNVLKMLTIANLDFFYYRPRIDFETFLAHSEGLCVGTACSASFLHLDGGVQFLKRLNKKIGEDLYLEIMPHDYEDQRKTNKMCVDLYSGLGIKLIATNDAHYVNEDDAESHEVLLACQTKKKWDDPNRWKFSVDGLFLCDADYLRERFKNQGCVPEKIVDVAIKNTVEVAEKCKDFRIKKQDIILPIPPQYKDRDEEEVIRELCEEGFKNKIENITKEYRDRFEYELDVLKDFKVIRYFLIVEDIISWCENNDILIGPGRGSAAGCLISYLLGITKVDPIKYGLLFERFLNPGRKGSLPDIDFDVPDIKRGEVTERLKTLYGEHNVAGITTFLKIEDKSALKDVAKVFDIPFIEVNNFSKTINDGLENALQTADGKAFESKYPEVIKHTFALRGQVKSHGRHAAGTLVSPIDLTLGTRSYLAMRSKQLVVGLDGGDAENQGLVKLDLLGLSTMTVVSKTLKLIKENHGKEIDPEKIPLDDPKIYKDVSNGDTVGCFQIGTHALTSLIKEMGVEDIYSLSDAVALVRPGAMDSGATAKYIARKKGADWEKKHPVYEEITEKTFGIVAYQEQIMFIFNKIAGLSLEVADKIRKVIGKKRDISEFEQYKNAFVNGCLEQETLSEKEALEFWEELGYHANYSFNQCLSKDESILGRYSRNKKRDLTIEELFKAKNDLEYAKKNNFLPLRSKLQSNGYGVALSIHEEDGRIKGNEIIDIRYSGVMDIFTVSTESGRTIKCTMNHSFPTPSGKKKLEEMVVGDLLFVKGDYEKCKKRYNFYSDGEAPENLPKKGQKGFQVVPDGGSAVYERTKSKCHEEKPDCDICGIEYGAKRFEVHHRDFDRENNNESNFQFVCVSCHKKIHYKNGRRKRFEKGIPVETEKIVSIEFLERNDCYDVEMDAPNHNFVVSSGIVTSNSHSLSYSIVSYWTAWFKHYYPTEFICASLTYGTKNQKENLVKEAQRLNLNIIPPKIGMSDTHEWTAKDGNLYVPFLEVAGIGPKMADTIKDYVKFQSGGFFSSKKEPVINGKLKTILEEIGAFGEKPTGDLDKYIDIGISFNPKVKYKKMYDLVGHDCKDAVPDLLSGNVKNKYLVKSVKNRNTIKKDLTNCSKCALIQSCKKPVPMTIGSYNVMIVDEYPGWKEDKKGKMFVGDAAEKILFPELQKHGYEKEDFCLSSVMKCKCKKPEIKEVEVCSDWIKKEIKMIKPFLILVFGNTGIKWLDGEEFGIQRKNGMTEWREELGVWICYCVSPISALFHTDAKENFESGIENFVGKLEDLGGFE